MAHDPAKKEREMSETVGDFLLARLAGEWGVKRIYGYPVRAGGDPSPQRPL
jgi:hypothetical protein